MNVYDDNIYAIESNIIIGSKKNLPLNTNLFSEIEVNYSLLLADNSIIVENKNDSLIITTFYFEPLKIHLLLISSYHELENQLTTSVPSLYLVVLYIMIFAILITIVMAHIQTKHIIILKKVIDQNKEGNLSIRYEPKTKDEIADLGNAFNSLLDRVQELLWQQEQHQKLKRKMELQMIQEQVKPHFLYNVLETINSLIRCQMNHEALTAVENLASFYRISLNNGLDIVSISMEMQLIEHYLFLQKMRYIEFMDYVLAINPAIHKYIIPKLTLQPLIENSIYHGIKEKGEKGVICISGYIEEGNVILEVFDTGIGIPDEKLHELRNAITSTASAAETHFGLSSVIKRLQIHYNGLASMHIDSKYGEYTCITISFPIIEQMNSERRTTC